MRKFWIIKSNERDGNVPPEYKIVENGKKPKHLPFSDPYCGPFDTKQQAQRSLALLLDMVWTSADGTRFDP